MEHMELLPVSVAANSKLSTAGVAEPGPGASFRRYIQPLPPLTFVPTRFPTAFLRHNLPAGLRWMPQTIEGLAVLTGPSKEVWACIGNHGAVSMRTGASPRCPTYLPVHRPRSDGNAACVPLLPGYHESPGGSEQTAL
jgi:hypothetical protein